MRPIDKGDTSMMSGTDFTKSRFHGPMGDVDITIGGSDISTIFGISPWRTKLELWRSKRKAYLEFHGKKNDCRMPITKGEANQNAKMLGHLYEPYVGKIFKKAMEQEGHHVGLITDKHTYQCGEVLLDAGGFPCEDQNGNAVLKYPFALANVDGLPIVDGTQVLLECKTTSAHNFETIGKWKDGICPEYYDLQVRWYMAIMDINVAYICCVWSLDEKDKAIIRIERDRQYEEEIFDTVSKFVDSIRRGIEPDKSTENPDLLRKYYCKVYGPSTPKTTFDISSEPDIEDSIEKMAKLKKEIAKTEKYLAELNSRLTRELNVFAPYYGTYENLMFSNEKFRCYITAKNEMSRAQITEESVAKVDPLLLRYGQSFNGTEFKRNINGIIKEKKKEVKDLERRKDTASAMRITQEIDDLSNALKQATIPSEWKETQKLSVSFYDPKDVKKQIL